MKKHAKCWEVFSCKEKDCPAYEVEGKKCWLLSGTHCHQEVQEIFLKKIEMCLDCVVFKSNMDITAMQDIFTIAIKQSKEREELLRESQERYRALVDNTVLGIAVMDTNYSIIMVNPTFADLFKRSASDFVGKYCFNEFENRKEVCPHCPGKRAMISGKTEEVETQGVRDDGSRFHVHNRAAPFFGADGELKGFIEMVEDTDARKKTEERMKMINSELTKAYAELKQAHSQILQQEKMASIGQLAAGVAHEINNPVGFIMSNLNSLQKYNNRFCEFIKIQEEVIRELSDSEMPVNIANKLDEHRKSLRIDYITDDTHDLIRESIEGAERVKRIVQDLKSFSRVDETEVKLSDINSGIESTVNIVWNELKYKTTLHKEYGDIPMTKCNLGQLNQVFMNILVNSAQAIEKQGEITIKTWQDNGDINVSISDTGCGIPKDKINRIFDPFFTTKEVGKGTGLGLSIAYDIVKKHNGSISVESEVEKGTTFTIKIPVIEGK